MSLMLTVISRVNLSFSSRLPLFPGYCQSRLIPSNMCSRRKLMADLMKIARLSALADIAMNLWGFRAKSEKPAVTRLLVSLYRGGGNSGHDLRANPINCASD